MLSISHAVTGAFIASNIQSPYISIPLILASHYLEDAVPHWDAGTGLGNGSKTKSLAIKHGIIDLVLAGIIVLAFYPSTLSQLTSMTFDLSSLAPIWGAFFGLLPDFLEAPRNFLGSEPFFLKPLNKFHHLFHHSIPRPLDGLFPQILLLVILYIYR